MTLAPDQAIELERGGDFVIVEETENRIALGIRRCPFGDDVRERPALRKLASNVFGHIGEENLGYARVELEKTLARGDSGCRIIVQPRFSGTPETNARDYFARDHAAGE